MEVQPPSRTEAEASGQGNWDEAQLEEAMERLKLLHVKVGLHSTHI